MVCQGYIGGCQELCTKPAFRSIDASNVLRLSVRKFSSKARAETNARRACDEELVRSRPPARRAAEKPVAAEIQPSSTYLYRSRQVQLGHSIEDDCYNEQEGLPEEEVSIEEDRRRTRAAARAGLTKAAQVTAKAGQGFLKVALPVSGWAMRTGFAAAASAVGKARPTKKKKPSK